MLPLGDRHRAAARGRLIVGDVPSILIAAPADVHDDETVFAARGDDSVDER
jgi:hypothetical protein